MKRSDSILQQYYMSKLPKAQKGIGLIAQRPAPVYDNIPNPALYRAKAEMAIQAKNAAAAAAIREKQGEIRPAGPKRSAMSKAWAIATNPMTALKYKMKGQDIPENFERGERNNLDMAMDVINPFGYVNAVNDMAGNVKNIANDPKSAITELPSLLLNGVQFIPAFGEAYMLKQHLQPGFKAARETFRNTADLPIRTRVKNAVNAGTLELPIQGDVPGHAYFGMTAEEAQKRMAKEMADLPRGAYSVDQNMSKNSAPLFWTQAARAPQEYTFVRPGRTQSLNWSGTQGKRVVNALPKGTERYIPEIQEIKDQVNQRIEYLKGLGTESATAEALRLEKEGIGSAIIAELPHMSASNPQAEGVFKQFMENYKPVLDKPIQQVNQRTGLNFPMTTIEPNQWNRSLQYSQPTIYAVKGNPLKDRLLPSVKQHLKERAERLYLGNMFKMPAGYRDNQLPDPPVYLNLDVNDYNFANGGPIVDPRGQWAHPGKDTIIPTEDGRITMQGVPYPVYGVDEYGNGGMMYPGGEYAYPGNFIYETPMMSKGGQHGGLDRWFAEKWVDVKSGKPCGRQEGENRAYPACRPSRRVSSQTPKTSSEMSPAEKAKFKRSKTSSERINYNHKRMQEGGMLPEYQMRGQVMSTADSIRHQANKILQYEQLRGGPGGAPLPGYSDPKYMNMLINNIYPQVKRILPNSSAMEAAEAMDFVFNAGWDQANNQIVKDPRAYALQEYYRQYQPSKLDADGKWAGRKNPAYSFDQEYNATIGKLSENDRRVMMNRGRDWYYRNINNPAPGVPNSNYYDTWYGRIWNTNDFQPFNPNNPNFKPKKK